MTIHRYREQALYRLGEFILVGPMTVGVCDCCRKVAFVVPIYEPDLLSRLRYLSEQDV